MEFLSWWFGHHYILSTLLCPFYSFLWAYYFGLKLRMVAVGAYLVGVFGLKVLAEVAKK